MTPSTGTPGRGQGHSPPVTSNPSSMQPLDGSGSTTASTHPGYQQQGYQQPGYQQPGYQQQGYQQPGYKVTGGYPPVAGQPPAGGYPPAAGYPSATAYTQGGQANVTDLARIETNNGRNREKGTDLEVSKLSLSIPQQPKESKGSKQSNGSKTEHPKGSKPSGSKSLVKLPKTVRTRKRVDRAGRAGLDDDGGQSVFNTSRPAHLGSGIGHGLLNIAKGVVLGAGALVAAPAHGAYKNGARGFATGLGKGLVAAVALPVAGVATAIHQVGYGAVNTPDYMKQTNQGKVYDDKTRGWVDKYFPLDEEFARVNAEYIVYLDERKALREERKLAARGLKAGRPASASASTSGSPKKEGEKEGEEERKVADREYYDALQVKTTATQAEIRKQYYRLARDCHPDKNRDDPQATEKFQLIGEAYQVLGDETRREQYDRVGKAATESMDFIDHSVFFAMLFGSDALTPYIGKLKLAAMVDMDGDEDDEDGEGAIAPLGKKLDEREEMFRVVQLAVLLRDRIAVAVAALEASKDDEMGSAFTAWKAAQRKVADTLCRESFGAPLVDAVGFVYENTADHFIGKKSAIVFGGTVAKLQHQKRQINIYWNALQAVARVQRTTKKAQKLEDNRKAKLTNRGKPNSPGGKDSPGTTTGNESGGGVASPTFSPGAENVAGHGSKSAEAGATQSAAAGTPPDATNTGTEYGAGYGVGPEGEANPEVLTAEEVEAMEKPLKHLLETMLQLCLADVNGAVRTAVKKALNDKAVDDDVRKRRAVVLQHMGRIFQAAAKHHLATAVPVDVKDQFTEAWIKTNQKADEDQYGPSTAQPSSTH